MPTKSLLKPEVKKLFEKAGEFELYASHLYQHIGNQLQRVGLFGGQKYFLRESKEELTHYQKLADFVNDMGDVMSVPAVERISSSIKSMDDALDAAYKAEYKLMLFYQDFYEQAEEVGDCITASYLIEFMQIQRKSVGEIGDLISKLERSGDIYVFDEEMGDLIA